MENNWLNKLRQRGKFIFDVVTNDKLKNNILYAIPFWFASLLTGLIAVGYTKLFGYSEELLHYLLGIHKWLIFLLAPICFCFASYIAFFFAPNARGSGIPQVMAAIDLSASTRSKKIGMLLSTRIIIVKIISSIVMLIGGGAIGREGPTIQIAGSVFRQVNKWIPASWPKLSNKSFILTGAAAGLAAAFNTPLGGIVFAIEELAKIHISLFRTALFSAVIIAGLTAQGFLGPYLYLGYPNVQGLRAAIFIGVAVAAILSGICGAIMSKVILALMKFRSNLNTGRNILFIISIGLVVACIAYFIDSHILGSGKDLMNTMLFTDNKHVHWYTVIFRILGPALAFNTGAAGGVFAPALAAGAAVGGLLAEAFHVIGANANILILSGMVGFLTGVTRTPFTSAILVLEMTDRHSVIFHLMIAALIANIAALVIDEHSFYEQLKEGYIRSVMNESVKASNEADDETSETIAG